MVEQLTVSHFVKPKPKNRVLSISYTKGVSSTWDIKSSSILPSRPKWLRSWISKLGLQLRSGGFGGSLVINWGDYVLGSFSKLISGFTLCLRECKLTYRQVGSVGLFTCSIWDVTRVMSCLGLRLSWPLLVWVGFSLFTPLAETKIYWLPRKSCPLRSTRLDCEIYLFFLVTGNGIMSRFLGETTSCVLLSNSKIWVIGSS